MPAREVRVDPQRNGQQLYLWSEFRTQAECWAHRLVDDVVVEAIAGNTDASLCERSDAWRFAIRIDLHNGEVAGTAAEICNEHQMFAGGAFCESIGSGFGLEPHFRRPGSRTFKRGKQPFLSECIVWRSTREFDGTAYDQRRIRE